MGKGRAPCCDKSQVKRGPWSPAEDLRLIAFVQKHGHDNWRALPKQAGLLRCGKSCRLRWINYLRPDVKRGNFTKEEEDAIIKLHQTLGNKWSKIASYLPGRTDNEIKNVWNTHLKKRLATIKNGNRDGYDTKESSTTTTTTSSASVISGIEFDLDSEIDQQLNRGPVTKKIRTAETITENSDGESEKKELSSPSMSSNNSNVTNCSHFEVSKPEDQDQTDTILFSDYIIEPYDVQNALDEVNKPEQVGNNSMAIPLESDYDFWNMLDTLSTFQSNNEGGQDQLQGPDQASHESSNIRDGWINEEVENKRWFRDLETELGLDTTKDGSQEKLSEDYQSLISESFDQYDDVPFRPETEIGYYHLWPSL